ncbi:MAG: ATP-dependent metallopeptidase FtsH/Yme1/Tma family protein, partial [Alphaproteobacteria bacterium]
MLIWAAIFLALVLLFQAFQGGGIQGNAQKLKYSDFVSQVKNGRVQEAVIQGRTVTGNLSDGGLFQTYTPDDPQLVQRLIDAGVNVTASPEEENRLISVLISWFPMLLLIGVWIYFMRHMQGGGG